MDNGKGGNEGGDKADGDEDMGNTGDYNEENSGHKQDQEKDLDDESRLEVMYRVLKD